MSLKNDAVVRTLSILEFDFCFHLEYNPDVTRYISQPHGYLYQFNGRKCRYTPDFLVDGSKGRSTFVEVKHSSQIFKTDFRERFAEKQRVAYEEHGRRLLLVSEKQIRIDPIYSNLKLLHRYSGLRTVTNVQKLVLEFIQRKQKVQLLEVSNYLGLQEHETLVATLCWLSSGRVQTDFKSSNFNLNSYVWC
jgi:hypothetical protein